MKISKKTFLWSFLAFFLLFSILSAAIFVVASMNLPPRKISFLWILRDGQITRSLTLTRIDEKERTVAYTPITDPSLLSLSDPSEIRARTAETLGVTVDRYLVLSPEVFADAVTRVGGLAYHLPHPLTDHGSRYVGTLPLDGALSLLLLTAEDYADVRADVTVSLLRRLLTRGAETAVELPFLSHGSVVTDSGEEDLARFRSVFRSYDQYHDFVTSADDR